MTGPNHLWSGDWERESAEAAAERPAPPIETPTIDETAPEPRPRRRFSARQLLFGIVGGLVVAGVAVALVISLGGSSKPQSHPRAHAATQPSQTPFPGSSGGVTPSQSNPTSQTTLPPPTTGPTAEWLGMQIVTSPGGAVVDTVREEARAMPLGSNPAT